jgi:nucleotide-binding universal stress UspA family protein
MTTHRIIVGVDGSAGARTALEWAVDECRIRACTLLVVHARERHADAGGPVMPGYDPVAEQLLTEHAAAASARRPSVPVTTLLGAGLPADTLIELSVDAELVVVGTRGSGGFTSTMLGSVSSRTAVHAHCPVAVVPQRALRAAGDVQGPVVVGVVAGQASRVALGFARREAQVRGARLVTVHADDEPAETLLHAAEGAQLLVVGARHSVDRWSTRLGPVPASVLHRSPCPVVVVGELPGDRVEVVGLCRQDASTDSLAL